MQLKMFSRSKILDRLRPVKCLITTFTERPYTKTKINLFIHNKVRDLLQNLTKTDIEKVYKVRTLGKPLPPPTYKLMTTSEIEEEREKIQRKTRWLMQMPPVLEPRKEINVVLAEDPALDGHDVHHAKHVFTDISLDLNSEERLIVVREPNGVLRKAMWNERHRMSQIYEPVEGRELETPKMFEGENFNSLLDREEYEFILDRACIQFEPDDSVYVEVTRKTYMRISEKSHFDRLLSTRHFGSMVFYLVLSKNIDNLLMHYLQVGRMDDAHALVELYYTIHPECLPENNNSSSMLETYINTEAKARDTLQLVLQTTISAKQEENHARAAEA